jgi:hypothetical protein
MREAKIDAPRPRWPAGISHARFTPLTPVCPSRRVAARGRTLRAVTASVTARPCPFWLGERSSA